ncbi:MAG TPA: hypothetical protein VGT44_01160 [Ktedonobacteraceae bacterium]|nr:hypothetical protein [Ktedonobacteraceae bacterium]
MDQDAQDLEYVLSEEADEARRLAVRENARRVMRESGMAEMLRTLNTNALKGRGTFHEYDSMVLLRWGTSTTRRHLWIEVSGNTIRFRLTPHRRCTAPTPICDGEYHTFTGPMWADRAFLLRELDKYFAKPVAETSSD